MWTLFKALVLRWLLARTLFKGLGLFALLVPLLAALKGIGLPVLIGIAILAFPLLLLLAAIGLPFLLAMAAMGVLLMLAGVVVSVGIVAIKIILPIVLVVWFVRWIFSLISSDDRKAPGTDTGPETI